MGGTSSPSCGATDSVRAWQPVEHLSPCDSRDGRTVSDKQSEHNHVTLRIVEPAAHALRRGVQHRELHRSHQGCAPTSSNARVGRPSPSKAMVVGDRGGGYRIPMPRGCEALIRPRRQVRWCGGARSLSPRGAVYSWSVRVGIVPTPGGVGMFARSAALIQVVFVTKRYR